MQMSQASNYVLNVRLCMQGRLYDVRLIYILILAKLQEFSLTVSSFQESYLCT